ncbi:heterokaryon incompatibility protein-domain-containing protein [Trametes elegans]|nr:heterokaryon incompatibility protein-domain-containing protein [Trametes elegans]
MWLINTSTYQLRYASNSDNTPIYAILSHCWSDDPGEEVTFADMKRLVRARRKRCWKKLEEACRTAREAYLRWLWDDTCCINKDSSAELSEAINFMFAWYRSSLLYLVYIADVPDNEDPSAEDSSFRRSRWFTRGWTLQELVATAMGYSAVFYSRSWIKIDTRRILAHTIAAITGVDSDLLESRSAGLEGFTIAQRMSWAAMRETTRPEDRAYSLMGLFDVHMPVIYGEGAKKAFRRLQLEIIRQSNDQTIFAWGELLVAAQGDIPLAVIRTREPDRFVLSSFSVLARSPSDFCRCGDFRSVGLQRLAEMLNTPPIRKAHFYDTNNGIRIQLPLQHLRDRLYRAALSTILTHFPVCTL